MNSRYHNSLLMDGCWSPSRPGLFFVTRKDGWLDIWDYYYRQNEVTLSQKISDYALTSIRINNVTGISQIGTPHPEIGKFCAIGDAEETIILLKLCDSLHQQQNDEKNVINEIFEREKQREEALKKQRLENEVRRNLMIAEQRQLAEQKQQEEWVNKPSRP